MTSTSDTNSINVRRPLMDIERVRRLLSEGGDPDKVFITGSFPDPTGKRTPLMDAAAAGRLDIMNVLLEHGADIERKDSEGDTALSLVSKAGQTEAMELLLGAGAATDHADAAGKTLLMHAVDRGSIGVAQVLVDAGVDLNAKDEWGNTALHHAASTDNSNITRILLAAGADHTIVNRESQTPENIARRPECYGIHVGGVPKRPEQLTKGDTLSVLVAHREQQVLRQSVGVTDDQEPVQRHRKM